MASFLTLAAAAAGQNNQGIRFEDVTSISGIDHNGLSFGASCGDLDGDGDVDLFLPRHYGWMSAAIFINRGDGTFSDRSNSLFADPQDARTGDRHGGTFVDLDGDGQRELLVTRGANRGQGSRANRFYELDQGQLTDRATARGLGEPLARSRTGLFLDVDLDGDLDHILATQERSDGQSSNVVLLQDAQGLFQPSAQRLLPTDSAESAQLTWIDGHGQLVLLNTRAPRAFDVSGRGILELTTQLGIPTDSLQTDLVTADFTGDGHLDLLSVRGRENSDYLVTQPNEVKFALVASRGSDEILLIPSSTDTTLRVRLFTHLSPSSVSIGANRIASSTLDFTLDSNNPDHVGSLTYASGVDTGILVSFDPIPQAWRLAITTDGWLQVDGYLETRQPFTSVGNREFDPDSGRLEPRLLTWEPGLGFADTTDEAGLATKLQARSVVAGDFDNDGDLDAYVLQSTTLRNLPNTLLENLGGGRFILRRDGAGAGGSTQGRGDTVAAADLDNDGRLDLIVTNGEGIAPFGSGPDQVFRNVGGMDSSGNQNHWLMLDLVGRAGNADAIGARVEVTTGSGRQMRLCDGGLHRYTQNDRRVHFGLGTHAVVDDLVIHWPNGQVQRRRNVPANRVLRIVQP